MAFRNMESEGAKQWLSVNLQRKKENSNGPDIGNGDFTAVNFSSVTSKSAVKE